MDLTRANKTGKTRSWKPSYYHSRKKVNVWGPDTLLRQSVVPVAAVATEIRKDS